MTSIIPLELSINEMNLSKTSLVSKNKMPPVAVPVDFIAFIMPLPYVEEEECISTGDVIFPTTLIDSYLYEETISTGDVIVPTTEIFSTKRLKNYLYECLKKNYLYECLKCTCCLASLGSCTVLIFCCHCHYCPLIQ